MGASDAAPGIFPHLQDYLRANPTLRSPQLQRALRLAEERYPSSTHALGEPMPAFLDGVLREFLVLAPDVRAITACLLLPEPPIGPDLAQIKATFGDDVHDLAAGARLLSHLSLRSRRLSPPALRLMVLRVARDVRSLLLALCVQRHLLDRLPQLPPVQQRSLALDALDLFAPAAARLGVYALKHAIEERAFAVAYPTDAAHIADQMAHIHESFGHFLEPTAMQLAASLAKNGIPARVEGREKHAYSIFRKMQEKSISDISELYDLFALRVIVASPEQCYLALGMLHQLARPIQHRFKDYIAFPKPNGYQSLHTTVTRLPGMPEGAFVEVQIRTELMHRAAEYGIAAHWSYKEGASSEDAAVQSQLVAHLLRAGDAKEAEVLRDEIFALSPTGEVAGFPDGATPLDFAFWVHTNVGLCYRSARVNGRIVPMEYRLENGDVVEILQHPVPHPSPQWLQFLHTDGARTRLKRFIAAEQRRSIESLLPPTPKAIAPAPRRIRIGGAVIPLTSPASPLVTAELPMPIAFARCCAPQEKQGCRITGVVSRGVVRVHRKECRLLTAVNPERIVRVTWAAREKRVKVKKG